MKKELILEKQSKLGKLIREKGYTQKQFAEALFNEKGYFIAVTNLSNYCSGYKTIKKIEIAKMFAEILQVELTEIL